jgi:hypothetical protein
MYDASKIVVGLAVFVVLATSPLWYNALSSASPAAPELSQPTNGSTECVEETMSLSDTCLDCHSKKDQFCDACHTYSAVDPYCWTCHVVPEEAQ